MLSLVDTGRFRPHEGAVMPQQVIESALDTASGVYQGPFGGVGA